MQFIIFAKTSLILLLSKDEILASIINLKQK